MTVDKSQFVWELKDLEGDAPEIFGIPTGTFLDKMFYKIVYNQEKDEFVKKELGGVPYLGVINVTGIPDTGKSILAEQFALTQANNNYKVLFLTVETPAYLLYSTFKNRANTLGFDFEKLQDNIIIVDASSSAQLREDIPSLLDTLKYAIEKKNTTITIIDSVTSLYEHKEVVARQIVRTIYNFLKKTKQTAMFVSQKRTSQGPDTAEAAGGLAVAHIVDGTIVMNKKIIETKTESSNYNLPIGSVLRTIRIDGCRITPHDDKTYVFQITDKGTIDIKCPLHELITKKS